MDGLLAQLQDKLEDMEIKHGKKLRDHHEKTNELVRMFKHLEFSMMQGNRTLTPYKADGPTLIDRGEVIMSGKSYRAESD